MKEHLPLNHLALGDAVALDLRDSAVGIKKNRNFRKASSPEAPTFSLQDWTLAVNWPPDRHDYLDPSPTLLALINISDPTNPY